MSPVQLDPLKAAHSRERARKRGDFRCERCHEKVRLEQGAHIPKCPNCGNETSDERVNEPSNQPRREYRDEPTKAELCEHKAAGKGS